MTIVKILTTVDWDLFYQSPYCTAIKVKGRIFKMSIITYQVTNTESKLKNPIWKLLMGIRYHDQLKINSENDDYIFDLLVRYQIDTF